MSSLRNTVILSLRRISISMSSVDIFDLAKIISISMSSVNICTQAKIIFINMSSVDIWAPKLIVAKEVEGHERLNVLDPSALVIQ